jgi:Protein of unknown function (DUF3592)
VADTALRATLAGILLFAIGLAIGGGAIVNYQRERAALDGWQRADAQVVEMVTRNGKTRPRVSFVAANGERIRSDVTGPLAGKAFQVGDAVVIIYPLEDPAHPQLESPAIRWARTVYAGAGGLALMALGGYIAWYSRQRGLS